MRRMQTERFAPRRRPLGLGWVLVLVSATAGLGCAARTTPSPILSDTRLGQIIVYRNGVAYFERFANPGEEALTMRVPAERVDDFLKSLSIVDEKTGEAMPVSYPTLAEDGGHVEMTIKLPPAHNRLRITYVTESPAWKPSYRVVLDEAGDAKLLGWAVVDNVSGEDWTNVNIGVGSTSALSFRYDLHSVRLVERETLSTGSLIAAAPPTGGSPYAVAGKRVRVVGGWSSGQLAALDTSRRTVQATSGNVQHAPAPDEESAGAARRPEARPVAPKEDRSQSQRLLTTVTNRVRGEGGTYRVEGFAQPGDSDPHGASLMRANQLRDELIANGVSGEQIVAVGTGVLNSREAARVVATEHTEDERDGDGVADASDVPPPDDGQPLGKAHFVSSEPLTLRSDHSAMISILNEKTTAERIYYYDPVSSRGSSEFAFNAVRIVNPSSYTLDSGPFTVYSNGQFLGEGLSEPILPRSTAFIPYALDRAVIADRSETTREEIERLLTIQRGIVSTETRRIRRTKLAFDNRSKEEATVYVRHQVAPGYKLREALLGKTKVAADKVQKLGGAHLVAVTIPAGGSAELFIDEDTPILKTVDIRTDGGVRAVAMYLQKSDVPAELKEKLDGVIEAHKQAADLRERIALLDEQVAVYRSRQAELNDQLVTLRKVREADKLRRFLSDKMKDISDRVHGSTLELSDKKEQLMTLHIRLQDRLAELTLKQKTDEKAGAQVAAKE